jgi:HSP20 family molecular chaperone IbpA
VKAPSVHWPRNPIPIEEYEDDTRYVLRAELPGLDPARDISVMVADGELTLHVDRVARAHHRIRSEFRYGSFRRQVVLPRRARDETTRANYHGGILEVSVELTRTVPIGRTVPVRDRVSRGGRRRPGTARGARPRG